MERRTRLTLAAALALLGAVDVWAWPGHGSSVGDAAMLITPAAWDAAFQHPNATGAVSVAGLPDVSAPYPGSGDAGNWTLSIAVKADIPVPASTTNYTTAGYTTGTEITLVAPDKLLVRNNTNGTTTVRSDPGWNACVYVVSNLTGHGFTNDSNAGFDPTCTGLLPTGCANAMSGNLIKNYAGGTNDCPILAMPSSCKSAFDANYEALGQGAGMNYFNGSVTYNSALETHQLGNTQPYSDAVHNGWLVVSLLAYGQNSTSSQNGSTSQNASRSGLDRVFNTPIVQLTCLRPDTVTAGSQLPSFAVRTTTGAARAFFLAGVAAVLLAL